MKFGWRAALGVLLSAVLLWWALHDVPFATVMGHVRAANVPLLLLAAVTATAIFPLRARRWRPILDPVAPGLPFPILFRPVAIGIMVSNVIPARVGELARAYALTRETDRVPFTAAVASIAVDRVFDAIVLLALMFSAMLDPQFAPHASVLGRPVADFARGGMALAGLLLVALYALVFLPDPLLRLARRVAGLVSPRFAEKVHGWLASFVRGLSVLRSPGRFAAVLGWTLAHWLVNALSYWFAMRAFGIEAPFSATLFVQAVIAIGVSIPQAPGFWGGFELLASESLRVYGVPKELGLAWGFAYHFVSFIPITLIGAYYFARMGLRMGEIRNADHPGSGPEPAPPAGRAA